MQAYVMGVYGDFIRIMSRDGKCVMTLMLDNVAKQVYDVEKFDELRDRMVSRGRLVDPDVTKALTKKFRQVEEYELGMTKDSARGNITTIDTVFKENKVRKKGSTTVDLIQIVDTVMHGYDATKLSKQYKRKSGKDEPIDVSGV